MKVYTGIDLGSNSIKIAVLEKDSNNSFHLLAKEEVKTRGMKKGTVLNPKVLSEDINKCISRIENSLSLTIKKCVIAISPQNVIYDMLSSTIKVEDPSNISGDDISFLIKSAVSKKSIKDYELITSSPVGFKIDSGEVVQDPKGLKSENLYAKIVATYMPRKDLIGILNTMELSGLEVIDITFKPIADYYEVRNERLDKTVGVIVNVGEDTTSISLYNKGIMIKDSKINIGSSHIDHDISYMYKLDLNESRKLKENFALASKRYASKYDEIDMVTEHGEKIKINQLQLTEVVEARIVEMLKNVKNEIKNLTNREISYIIVLGGLSEITGFQYVVQNILGESASVYNSATLGIRHNKYTSVVGLVKYFDNKLELRGISIDMFNTSEINRLTSTEEEDNNAAIETMFGSFLNKEDKV